MNKRKLAVIVALAVVIEVAIHVCGHGHELIISPCAGGNHFIGSSVFIVVAVIAIKIIVVDTYVCTQFVHYGVVALKEEQLIAYQIFVLNTLIPIGILGIQRVEIVKIHVIAVKGNGERVASRQK